MNEKVMMMEKNKKIYKKRKESGQSMVELSMSIVVLLILLAGVVDLGRVAFYYIAIRDAAQEAASYAAVFPNNNQQIFARALDGIAGSGVDPSRVEIEVIFKKESGTYECQLSEGCSSDTDTTDSNVVPVGSVIQITVTDPAFPITMPLLGTFLGSQTINLNSTIQDVVVRVPEE
jgi:Flp pilus assembly protein TadG